MSKIVKTGGIVSVSGQYKPKENKTEVTFVKGNRVPPTKFEATTFAVFDATRQEGGK